MRQLRAGPLRLRYDPGEIRYVRLGDREVIRRLYVAVRDRNWGTVPLVLSNERIEDDGDAFKVTFDATHKDGPVDFRWRGTIEGDSDGTLRFEMDGEVHADFLRSRIGFCVLHPVRECAGQPVWVEHPDGTREQGVFPADISPHQPFFDIQAMAHEAAPGTFAELRFEGDVFETEDQRNWTDASFKTYCTPLRLPYPVEVKKGEKIRQVVWLALGGEVPDATPVTPTVPTIVIGDPVGPLPPIGLGRRRGELISEEQEQRIAQLWPTHLRVDLDLAADGWSQELDRGTYEALHTNSALELALHLSDDAERELRAVAVRRDELRPPVRRFVVFKKGERTTAARWLALARDVLKTGVPVVGGTDAYFTELNRDRPELEAIDEVIYSINPQVHAFDDDSLVENLEAQAWTVQSARRFVGDKPIVVSPVTLLPRYKPDGSKGEGAPPEPPSDPRQATLFGAAWTVGSLKYLAESGVAGITYYETAGPRGVVFEGGVHPLYHALFDAIRLRGGQVLSAPSSDPLVAEALVLREGLVTRVLLANLRPERIRVRIGPLPGEATVRVLDERNVAFAMAEPVTFTGIEGEPLKMREGWSEIELRPHAVARIDAR